MRRAHWNRVSQPQESHASRCRCSRDSRLSLPIVRLEDLDSSSRRMVRGGSGFMVCVMAGSPPPLARRRRWTASPRADVLLAVLLGAVVLQSASDEQGLKEPAWAVVALLELTALPLAVRRRWPLAVLGVTLAAAIVGDLLFS